MCCGKLGSLCERKNKRKGALHVVRAVPEFSKLKGIRGVYTYCQGTLTRSVLSKGANWERTVKGRLLGAYCQRALTGSVLSKDASWKRTVKGR